MTEDQKKNFETQLWGIANLLRGKISAGDNSFILDYIFGFTCFKYFPEKQYTDVTDPKTLKANEIEGFKELKKS